MKRRAGKTTQSKQASATFVDRIPLGTFRVTFCNDASSLGSSVEGRLQVGVMVMIRMTMGTKQGSRKNKVMIEQEDFVVVVVFESKKIL